MENTPDSPNRTTAPGPTASSSPETPAVLRLEERTVPVSCPTHGPQEARSFKVFDAWTPARCPECEKQSEAVASAGEADRRRTEEIAARETLIRKHLCNAAVPPRFSDRSFANYAATDTGAKKALAVCREYADGFLDRQKAGASLILCGNAGTGKTHLACAIANHVIRAHAKPAVYMTVGRAMRRVKDTYRRTSEASEQDVISAFAAPSLLVLDEVGVQYGTDAERNILFEIVNERYEQVKSTVLISNLALPALTEFVGERVVDRMRENGGRLVVFDWKSHRGAA